MEKIRDCLDEGRDFEFEGSTTAIFSVCETLLRLLDALPEPIVPFGMYQRCVDSYQSYQLAKQAVSQIPTVHYNVFVYLTAFLREVISHSSANGLTAENLGKFDIFSDLNLHSLHFGPLFFFSFFFFPSTTSTNFLCGAASLAQDSLRKIPRRGGQEEICVSDALPQHNRREHLRTSVKKTIKSRQQHQQHYYQTKQLE